MDAILNAVEVRVIGSLIEKQITTPEYYPLTLNALVNACNQISNRDPVVSYDEKTVVRALDSLREKQLAWMVTGAGSRVPKYEHRLAEALRLAEQELAALCVLMLRGPQTVGEIRGRAARMYEFKELDEVEMTLQSLMTAEPRPLITKLPRQAGMKESRYAHLLSGEVRIEEPQAAPRLEAATIEVRAENERIARLEGEVERLRHELAELKELFLDFKKQFE
ncbi:MAG TPA: YceH family protein [Blastocatellia bacterium]|nr:YceH family protein [Blastocatellia bacterium]